MYTQCNSCATLFRISARHLREARGKVRCCLCHGTFDALPSLTDRLPPDLPAEDLLAARRKARMLAAASIRRSKSGDEDVRLDSSAAKRTDRDLFLDLPFDAPRELAAEADKQRPRGSSGWLNALAWTVGILLLIVLFVIQYAYAMREDLARYPRLRPWLQAMCVVANCELPMLRDLSRINVLQRRVAAHPERSGALLVKATLVNDASFRQPYPELRLSFLNLNGQVEASRWFTPEEYLEDPQMRNTMTEGMPSKQPVAVRLELVDPGQAAEGFEIGFR